MIKRRINEAQIPELTNVTNVIKFRLEINLKYNVAVNKELFRFFLSSLLWFVITEFIKSIMLTRLRLHSIFYEALQMFVCGLCRAVSCEGDVKTLINWKLNFHFPESAPREMKLSSISLQNFQRRASIDVAKLETRSGERSVLYITKIDNKFVAGEPKPLRWIFKRIKYQVAN